jgi:hypothetical protein
LEVPCYFRFTLYGNSRFLGCANAQMLLSIMELIHELNGIPNDFKLSVFPQGSIWRPQKGFYMSGRVIKINHTDSWGRTTSSISTLTYIHSKLRYLPSGHILHLRFLRGARKGLFFVISPESQQCLGARKPSWHVTPRRFAQQASFNFNSEQRYVTQQRTQRP